MNPTIKALRAIGTEFAWRIYTPLLIIVGSVSIVLVGISIWLTTLSAWWWILCILFFILLLIAAAIFTTVGMLIRTIRPAQNKTQSMQVKKFVDKIQTVADVASTPKSVILFRIVRDLISKREDSYTRRISSETLAMQHDLRDIIASFK